MTGVGIFYISGRFYVKTVKTHYIISANGHRPLMHVFIAIKDAITFCVGK